MRVSLSIEVERVRACRVVFMQQRPGHVTTTARCPPPMTSSVDSNSTTTTTTAPSHRGPPTRLRRDRRRPRRRRHPEAYNFREQTGLGSHEFDSREI